MNSRSTSSAASTPPASAAETRARRTPPAAGASVDDHNADFVAAPEALCLKDQRLDDGFSAIDDSTFALHRNSGKGPVLESEHDVLFELVEPPANPTRYDELLQRGPRYRLKSELDRYIDFLARQVITHIETSLPESEVRSICAKCVMRNWRPAGQVRP